MGIAGRGGSQPGWPIALIAQLKIGAKSAPECPSECGECKSYLGNAQMPSTLISVGFHLIWIQNSSFEDFVDIGLVLTTGFGFHTFISMPIVVVLKKAQFR